MSRVSKPSLRRVAGRFLCALAVTTLAAAGADARPIDIRSTQYIPLQDFEDTFGRDFIGPVDTSIVGFFSALRGFTGNSILELSGGSRVPQFDTFIQEAQGSLDSVPIPSGSASVAYTYDPKLETFVRWERPFTPALSQNAYTSGKGVLTLGSSFSNIDFKQYDDFDHDSAIFVVGKGLLGESVDVFDVLYFNFKLRERVFGFSAQYGVLDNLDLGIFVPVVDLDFRAKGVDTFVVKTPTKLITLEGREVGSLKDLRQSDFTTFNGQFINGIRFSKRETNVADIVLRSKLYLASAAGVDFGALLNLSLPTGDDDNLLGTGSTRVDPRILISTSSPRFSVHVNAGPHFDTDDSDLDRFDYSAGGELQLASWASLAVDQVGRVQYSGNEIKKFEIVPGIKVKVYEGLVTGFNAIVPLNREGLTTDFIPNVAADLSFVF